MGKLCGDTGVPSAPISGSSSTTTDLLLVSFFFSFYSLQLFFFFSRAMEVKVKNNPSLVLRYGAKAVVNLNMVSVMDDFFVLNVYKYRSTTVRQHSTRTITASQNKHVLLSEKV